MRESILCSASGWSPACQTPGAAEFKSRQANTDSFILNDDHGNKMLSAVNHVFENRVGRRSSPISYPHFCS